MALTDDLERLVTISEAPPRIISLSPSNTEIVFALGLENRVVGVTKYCNYPPEGENIFHNLSGYPQIDPEAIVQMNPEIIITGTGTGEKRNDSLNWAKTEDSINETGARENNRIYQAQGDLITRAGPRIVDALEMIARIVHPETFLATFSVFYGHSVRGVHCVV